MRSIPEEGRHGAPARFDRPGAATFVVGVAAAAFLLTSFRATDVSMGELLRGGPNALRILGEMFPPSLARAWPVAGSLLQTFQMAVAGTAIGCAISLPLAVLATRHLSPHPVLHHATRVVVAICRTVPDLVWALLFVAIVGLGPFAGVLAIAVDKIGFCGRFFAEAMEEADRRPQEALRALGAARPAIILGAVIPGATPGLINAALAAPPRDVTKPWRQAATHTADRSASAGRPATTTAATRGIRGSRSSTTTRSARRPGASRPRSPRPAAQAGLADTRSQHLPKPRSVSASSRNGARSIAG